ncbi:MAG: DUF503 domain-containing protein [Isosphaeraceae bacterium]|nr:DUF503 domain-containing protein [Isosphaeraceae bacterium]
MTVATLCLELLITNCTNQRAKRRCTRAILDKLHRHFNVAVAEMEDHDPGHARLAVVTVARTRHEARERLERVAEAVAAHPRAALLSQVITEV